MEEEEAIAGLDEEGGRDEESKSWGRRERTGEDNAELVDDDDDNNDPLSLNGELGDGGRPVMIFVAGRISLLTWPVLFDMPRSCVAPSGISM